MPKYKRIIFSDHCEERQSQRGITKQQKLRVLKDPTNELPAKRAGRRKFWKKVDGTKLVVLVKEDKNAEKAIVITSYWRGN